MSVAIPQFMKKIHKSKATSPLILAMPLPKPLSGAHIATHYLLLPKYSPLPSKYGAAYNFPKPCLGNRSPEVGSECPLPPLFFHSHPPSTKKYYFFLEDPKIFQNFSYPMISALHMRLYLKLYELLLFRFM